MQATKQTGGSSNVWAGGRAAAHRVLDLVLDDVERILRGGHPLMAVPERCGLEQTSIEGSAGGFNWQELGGEEIPAALMMIPNLFCLRSPLGLVASPTSTEGDRRPTSDDVGFGVGWRWAGEVRSESSMGCVLRAISAWFVRVCMRVE